MKQQWNLLIDFGVVQILILTEFFNWIYRTFATILREQCPSPLLCKDFQHTANKTNRASLVKEIVHSVHICRSFWNVTMKISLLQLLVLKYFQKKILNLFDRINLLFSFPSRIKKNSKTKTKRQFCQLFKLIRTLVCVAPLSASCSEFIPVSDLIFPSCPTK